MAIVRQKGPLAALLLNLVAGSGFARLTAKPRCRSPLPRLKAHGPSLSLHTFGHPVSRAISPCSAKHPPASARTLAASGLQVRWHGRSRASQRHWGLFGDIMYAKTKSDGSATRIFANVPSDYAVQWKRWKHLGRSHHWRERPLQHR